MKQRVCQNPSCLKPYQPASSNQKYCTKPCWIPKPRKRKKDGTKKVCHEKDNAKFHQDEFRAVFVPIKRICLSCDRPFMARGKFNRRCLSCKEKEKGYSCEA